MIFKILTGIFIVLYALISYWNVKHLYNIYNVKTRALREPSMPLFSKYASCVRYDAISWNQVRCYILGAQFFPIRAVTLVLGQSALQALTLLNRMILGKETVTEIVNEKGEKQKIVSFEQEQTKLFNFVQRFLFSIFARSLAFICGLSYENKKQKVSDFFSDYAEYEKKQKDKLAPIIICNHSTAFDYLYFLMIRRPAAFLANENVKTMTFHGKLSQTMQCLYVSRSDEKSKKKSLDDIKNRTKQIEEGKDFPQILVFPEGITNCNEELMNFKPGAFESFAALKIYAQTIESKVQKIPSWSLVSLAEHASLLMSDTPHPITMYEFENFDPNYTLDKHGITKDHPDAINLVIKDVRYQMEYGCGLRTKQNTTGMQKNELEHILCKIPNGVSLNPPKFSKSAKTSQKDDK